MQLRDQNFEFNPDRADLFRLLASETLDFLKWVPLKGKLFMTTFEHHAFASLYQLYVRLYKLWDIEFYK